MSRFAKIAQACMIIKALDMTENRHARPVKVCPGRVVLVSTIGNDAATTALRACIRAVDATQL
jgi:hypothetical protein